jgi:hypothetical protein
MGRRPEVPGVAAGAAWGGGRSCLGGGNLGRRNAWEEEENHLARGLATGLGLGVRWSDLSLVPASAM